MTYQKWVGYPSNPYPYPSGSHAEGGAYSKPLLQSNVRTLGVQWVLVLMMVIVKVGISCILPWFFPALLRKFLVCRNQLVEWEGMSLVLSLRPFVVAFIVVGKWMGVYEALGSCRPSQPQTCFVMIAGQLEGQGAVDECTSPLVWISRQKPGHRGGDVIKLQ